MPNIYIYICVCVYNAENCVQVLRPRACDDDYFSNIVMNFLFVILFTFRIRKMADVKKHWNWSKKDSLELKKC